MPTTLLERLSRELTELETRSRLRALAAPGGIDFTSNDYLGLARHPALTEALRCALARSPVGSAGSRLLRGNHAEHEALEAAAARFFRAEAALYFSSGFDANLALFSSLPTRHDAIVVDERAHASVKEGARASFARKYTARHNDLQSFEDQLRKARRAGAKGVFIAVESVYSMDGDFAPLAELLSLARAHDAMPVIDEAHATGIFGPTGRGLSEGLRGPMLALHTCGKALGASGALVVGDRVVKEYLVNTARPFIYSTAPSPLMAAAVRRALGLIDEEPWRRERLLALAQRSRKLLSAGPGAQIIPIILGDDARTLRAARELQARGFDVRAIRPPTVPAGSSRLRVSLGVERSPDEVRALAAALQEIAPHG